VSQRLIGSWLARVIFREAKFVHEQLLLSLHANSLKLSYGKVALTGEREGSSSAIMWSPYEGDDLKKKNSVLHLVTIKLP